MFCKINIYFENVGSCWTTNAMIRSFSSLCVISLRRGNVHPLAYHVVQLLLVGILRQTDGSCCYETKSRSRPNVEDGLICAISYIEHRISMLSNNKQDQPAYWLWHTLCYSVVFVSTLFMCNSCRIGEYLQLVGNGPLFVYYLGHMLVKVENPWLRARSYKETWRRCTSCGVGIRCLSKQKAHSCAPQWSPLFCAFLSLDFMHRMRIP